MAMLYRAALAVIGSGLLPAPAGAGELGGRILADVTFAAHGGPGEVWVKPTTPWDNPDNCDQSDVGILYDTDWLFEGKLSALLTAVASGKEISIWAFGCTPTPYGSRPRIWTVTIKS